MNTRTVVATIVRFPHGTESVPLEVNGKSVRFASIDEDGALLAWTNDEAPAFDADMGCWIAPGTDVSTVRLVCDGEYTACAESVRQIQIH
jgi:hypothetical protein